MGYIRLISPHHPQVVEVIYFIYRGCHAFSNIANFLLFAPFAQSNAKELMETATTHKQKLFLANWVCCSFPEGSPLRADMFVVR